jgi:carbon storage regulator
MLVLTRGIGEAIVLGADIRVTVLAVNGNKVRLGFEAPPSVSFLRAEVAARQAGAPVGAPGIAAGQAEAAGRAVGDSHQGR